MRDFTVETYVLVYIIFMQIFFAKNYLHLSEMMFKNSRYKKSQKILDNFKEKILQKFGINTKFE